jgi:predicted Zn-ribbon and HTH transcriptional regulator
MSRDLPDRAATQRQALRAALERGPLTAHELSAVAGIPERDVAGHLGHLERTAKARGEAFIVEPASCIPCGFVFKKRERLQRPSRCPRCRSEHIAAPRFELRAE